MDDKKRQDLLEALSTTDVKDKLLIAVKKEAGRLDVAAAKYNKAHKQHKAAFLELSKATTANEKTLAVASELSLENEKTLLEIKEAQSSLDSQKALFEQTKAKFADFEKKARAQYRKAETDVNDVLEAANKANGEAAELQGYWNKKVEALKGVMNAD